MSMDLDVFPQTVREYDRDYLPEDRVGLATDIAHLLAGEMERCSRETGLAVAEFSEWLISSEPTIPPVARPRALGDLLGQRVIRSLIPTDWIGWLAIEGEICQLTAAWRPRMFARGGPEAVVKKFQDRLQPRRTPLTQFDVLREISPLDGNDRLCRLARHAVNSYTRLVRAEGDIWDLPTLESMGDFSEPVPDRSEQHQDVQAQVRACLDTLSEQERKALEMRHDRDMDCQAIAEKMGLTRSGVYQLLYKSRQRFRDNYRSASGDPG
jgi:RNA polymerase sigma factor (sigma-70 family)